MRLFYVLLMKKEDDVLVNLAVRNQISVFRGST